MMEELKGIFSALITPMDQFEELNLQSLREVVRWQLERGVEGFYVCGSSGEGLLLSKDERKQVLETVIDEVDGRVPVLCHTGTLATRDVIELTRHAKACGAVAASMIPPYYYKFTTEEIASYYLEVTRNVDLPIIIYNIPAFTGVNLSFKDIAKLLENESVIGVKHTSMNMYDLERCHSISNDSIFFNGYDEVFLSGLSAGANAAIGTTINLFPDIFIDIKRNFYNGKIDEAKILQNKINIVIEAFVDVGIFNAIKYSYTLLGIDCGSCRKPFNPLTDEQKKKVESILYKMELL
ncbi:N-acetylneuraminate lyase [Photobacterium sp. DNB23_23_1]